MNAETVETLETVETVETVCAEHLRRVSRLLRQCPYKGFLIQLRHFAKGVSSVSLSPYIALQAAPRTPKEKKHSSRTIRRAGSTIARWHRHATPRGYCLLAEVPILRGDIA